VVECVGELFGAGLVWARHQENLQDVNFFEHGAPAFVEKVEPSLGQCEICIDDVGKSVEGFKKLTSVAMQEVKHLISPCLKGWQAIKEEHSLRQVFSRSRETEQVNVPTIMEYKPESPITKRTLVSA